MEILNYAFMQRALLAAVLVGITAPAIGIYLVQRRQASWATASATWR